MPKHVDAPHPTLLDRRPRASRTRRCTVWFAVCVVAMAVLAVAAWHNRYRWVRHNFRVVEPGRVYAGGYQRDIPLASIIKDYRIKTVVSLRPEGAPHEHAELEVLAAHHVDFKRVVVYPAGPREELAASVEQAISLLAEPQNQPVFVHCRGGYHRTGAVIAVYRIRHCGWSKDAALVELEDSTRSKWTEWPREFLEGYQSTSHAPYREHRFLTSMAPCWLRRSELSCGKEF